MVGVPDYDSDCEAYAKVACHVSAPQARGFCSCAGCWLETRSKCFPFKVCPFDDGACLSPWSQGEHAPCELQRNVLESLWTHWSL